MSVKRRRAGRIGKNVRMLNDISCGFPFLLQILMRSIFPQFPFVLSWPMKYAPVERWVRCNRILPFPGITGPGPKFDINISILFIYFLAQRKGSSKIFVVVRSLLNCFVVQSALVPITTHTHVFAFHSHFVLVSGFPFILNESNFNFNESTLENENSWFTDI